MNNTNTIPRTRGNNFDTVDETENKQHDFSFDDNQIQPQQSENKQQHLDDEYADQKIARSHEKFN